MKREGEQSLHGLETSYRVCISVGQEQESVCHLISLRASHTGVQIMTKIESTNINSDCFQHTPIPVVNWKIGVKSKDLLFRIMSQPRIISILR